MAEATIETRTARIWQRPDRIVHVQVRAAVRQSLDDAHANFEASLRVGGGTRLPILIDLRAADSLSPEARHYLTGQRLIDAFCALALLVEASPFGRMMGNIYFRVARPGIPVKLFSDEGGALAWLAEHAA